MPYEMIVTNANDLTETAIGFGNRQEVARNVFDWTWRGLVTEGYVSLHNTTNPLFIEIMQRRGPSVMYIELRYTPDYDFGNALRLINMLALQAVYPNHLHTGMLMGETVRAEEARKNARYRARVTAPDGRCETYYLLGGRVEAIKAFNGMVRKRMDAGWRVMRCQDADMKWMALDTNGATTLEFVEVQA